MIYVNTKTGAEIDCSSLIYGENWIRKDQVEEKTVEKKEEVVEEVVDEVIEEPKSKSYYKKDLEEMTNADLKDILDENMIDYKKDDTKAVLIKHILDALS
ncbi:MAG: hypothetical protein SPI59_01330 [Finegoldia sp.]|nr:hypothetical protein [Finegoldia sp.]